MSGIAAPHPSGTHAPKQPTGDKVLTHLRNFQSRRMFQVMRQHMRGDVLDVGGHDFYLTAKRLQLPFTHWTTIEPVASRLPVSDDPAFRSVHGDGCDMTAIPTASVDTVLSIQVVEHVFEPIKMIEEIGRVLKPGGTAIIVAPQTSALHMAPLHYYNFTRYWLIEACARAQLEMVSLEALGGRWSTTASHMFYFLLQSVNYPRMHVPEEKRPLLFFLLWPLMALTAILAIPWCLFLALGDLAEEPNNHLVVARKR